jgi:hypothetical protein
MNRAVAARLRDPSLSLYAALFVGGFNYPSSDEASTLDDENVTLGQRKNQLLRRLREQNRKPRGCNQGRKQSIDRSNLAEASQIHNDTLFQLSLQNTSAGDGWKDAEAKKPGPASLMASSDGKDAVLKGSLGDGWRGAEDKKVGPVSPTPFSQCKTSTMPVPEIAGAAHHHAIMPPECKGKTSIFTSESSWPPPASAVLGGLSALGVPPEGASFSFGTEMHSAESCARGPDPFALHAASTTQYNGSNRLENRLHSKDDREMEGLRFFHQGLQNLYLTSMAKAGYTTEETTTSSQSYRRFAFLAWQQECMRLQKVMTDEAAPDNQFSTI